MNLGLIFKMIFLDQCRQDFIGIHKKIKQKLGLSLPVRISWAVALLSQTMFAVLLCAIVLESIPKGNLWWIITSLVLVFNLLLPGTMARQNAIRVSGNPVQRLLWQSPYPQGKLLFAWLMAETGLFWLHELSFQLIAFYTLIRVSPSWGIGVLCIILWIFVVTNIYLSVLYREIRKRWQTLYVAKKVHEALYLMQCLGISILLGIFANQILIPMTSHPISSDFIHIDTLPLALKELSIQLKGVLLDKVGSVTDYYYAYRLHLCLGIVFIVMVLAVRVLSFVVSPIQLLFNKSGLRLKDKRGGVFNLYRLIASKAYPLNPWITRDIFLLERLQSHLRLPLKLHVVLPPAISSILAIFYLSSSVMTPKGCIIAFWLGATVALFQSTWLWLWSYPMLHSGSEGRNIDLVCGSPLYSVGDYMQSKTQLIQVLLLPFQLVLSVLFLISMLILGGSWVEYSLGFIGMWGIFYVVCILSTWWMTYCTHFENEGLLSMRLDSYEFKLLQQLYHYPRRLMIAGLLTVFIISFFSDHRLEGPLLYGTFSVLLIVCLLCNHLYRRVGERYSLRRGIPK